MGKTSKPVHLLIDKALLDASPEQWNALTAQGHVIETIQFTGEPIIIAPYAMRCTVAMITDFPKAIELLIQGARALQRSPMGGADWTKGKSKRVSNTTKGKRKNNKKQTQDDDGTQQSVIERVRTVEGREEDTVSETSNREGNGQDTKEHIDGKEETVTGSGGN